MSTEEQVVEGQARESDGNGREIVRRPDRTPLSQRDPVSLAQHFAASGYFQDARDMSKAVVKIVAGEELGFGPMTAMNGIHIIEGKPSLSANLLATLVKKSDRYDFRPTTVGDEAAELAFFEDGEEVGRSKFTIAQARRAGLVRKSSGWEKYPEAMLFARALSQGVRWYCPDVTAGNPAYTPEELGAEVDARGEVVAVEAEIEAPDLERPSEEQIEQIEELLGGAESVGIEFQTVQLIFGAARAEAPPIDRMDSKMKAVRALSREQADHVASALDAAIEDAAGEGEDDGD